MEDKVSNDTLKHILIALSIIAILILTIIITVIYMRQKLTMTPSAKTGNINSVISLDNSYIFASPVRAKAGSDLIRITVFVLDNGGLGVYNKDVIVGNEDSGLTINKTQATTDETGKALFDISSNTPGTYFVEVMIDKLTVPQKVKIVFD
ncbi:MAG: hypothetical protein UX28_C0008G0004 [Candidatus Pacebacteria bacterium GW2011_GWA1_46_10]|nr:MAG: hypothetical protein UX28_C0008G0004 [Candidatus Pacebacteria bacterium GW2011_GWA1_46_10]